jgi:hypothetical protein
MTTQRIGWLAAAGMTLIVAVGACIPAGVRIPASTPGKRVDPSERRCRRHVAVAVGSSARPSFTYPTPTPLPTFLVYTVRSGDTLTSIAREQGTTARSIAFWNRQRYPSLDPRFAALRPESDRGRLGVAPRSERRARPRGPARTVALGLSLASTLTRRRRQPPRLGCTRRRAPGGTGTRTAST